MKYEQAYEYIENYNYLKNIKLEIDSYEIKSRFLIKKIDYLKESEPLIFFKDKHDKWEKELGNLCKELNNILNNILEDYNIIEETFN